MQPVRLILLVAAILAAMVIASLQADGDDGWEATLAWASQQRAAPARWLAVPRLVDAPPVGDAVALRAQANAAPVTVPEMELLERALAGEAVDATALATALAKLAPGIAALRAAARAPHREAGGEEPVGGLGEVFCAALLVARAGPPTAAVPTWIDLLANGLALANGSSPFHQLFGASLLERTVSAIRGEDLLALSDAAAMELACALESVDGALRPESLVPWLPAQPAIDSLRDAAAFPASRRNRLRERLSAWRQGFSVLGAARAEVAARVEALQEFERSPAASAEWPERRQGLQALSERARAIRGGRFSEWQHCLAKAVEHEEERRAAVARLRLLRSALAWRLGRPLPDLRDPLGDGPLHVAAGADAFVARSAQPGLERVVRR